MIIEGSIVRNRRKTLGMSQAFLGVALGYSDHQFIGQVERGRSRIPSRTRAQWAEKLDVAEGVLVVAHVLDGMTIDFGKLTDSQLKLYISMTAGGQGYPLQADEVAEIHRIIRGKLEAADRVETSTAEVRSCLECGDRMGDDDLYDDFHVFSGQQLHQVRCECGVAGPACRTRDGAIARWNGMMKVTP